MLLNATISYLEKGFSVVPCRLYFDEKGKCKKPATVKWQKYQKERTTKTTILTQWKDKLINKEGIGVAILTGEISDLIVVDIDTETALNDIRPYLGEVKTVTVRTPGDGYHIYYRYREGLNTTAGLNHDGLDLRAEGGYVVGPPSQYPTGVPYQFVKGRGFSEIEIAKMPDPLFNYLKSLIKERGQKETTNAKKETKTEWFHNLLENGVHEGARTTKLVEAIGYMLGKQVPKDIIKSTIILLNKSLKNPLSEKELKEEVLSSINRISKDKENAVVEELNKSLALVVLENGDRVIAEKYLNFENEQELRFAKVSQVRESFVNKTVLINKKPESVFEIWRQHPERKEFSGVIFNPSEEPWESGPFINLWKGLQRVPKPGDWSLFRWHIENIISKEYHEWILQWMARIVQDPGGERPGSVLVMRGGQGCGKGTFANIFGEIFGDKRYFFRVNKISDLTGRFNDDLKTALLLHIDEATWGGDKESAGVLKSLVTEPTRRVEPKGINAFHIKNLLNLIISSNNDWVVPIGAQERRFFVLDIPNTKQGDTEYFQKIYDQMENGGIEAMMYDLLRMPYDIKTLRTVPRTVGAMQQAVRGIDLVSQFWLDRLYKGTLIDQDEFWKYIVVNERIYQQYQMFCHGKMAQRGMDSMIAFGIRLKNICPQTIITKRRFGTKRISCRTFPSLMECRETFDKILGFKFDWPEICEPEGVSESMRNSETPEVF